MNTEKIKVSRKDSKIVMEIPESWFLQTYQPERNEEVLNEVAGIIESFTDDEKSEINRELSFALDIAIRLVGEKYENA